MSEMERLVNLLHLERKASRPFGAARSAEGRLPTVESCGFERGTAAHAKTRRKLEKAEHDRDRYARRIALMQAQSKAENAAAN